MLATLFHLTDEETELLRLVHAKNSQVGSGVVSRPRYLVLESLNKLAQCQFH